MTLTDFVMKLDKVKSITNGFIACCPAHDDKSPSLSVKQGDDGRILVHCFAGCSHREIVDAMGLEPADLFAESGLSASQRAAYAKQKRRDALKRDLATESLILQMAKHQRAQGKPLSDTDRVRVEQAIHRVREIRQEVG